MAEDKKSKIKKDEVLKLKEDLKNEKDKNLRLLAEFENFRKREIDEKQKIRDMTISNLVSDLLPIIENFEDSLITKDNKEMFVKGVEYIHKNLLKMLEEHKVNSFTPKIGESFDPKLHEPIVVDREGEESKVLGVLRRGFKHKDRVIKPSKVEVKKA